MRACGNKLISLIKDRVKEEKGKRRVLIAVLGEKLLTLTCPTNSMFASVTKSAILQPSRGYGSFRLVSLGKAFPISFPPKNKVNCCCKKLSQT